ncbi:MAG: polysaccharide pyruvyl transferase family protein, partial [Pseudomonadota bacterium]|nr:polysaccharide pyruvyl transferase family protein [Pseudomonadota bacterium]
SNRLDMLSYQKLQGGCSKAASKLLTQEQLLMLRFPSPNKKLVCQLRSIVVAPADSGNLGDEAMMFGALYLLRRSQITLVNDSGCTGWKSRLIASPYANKIVGDAPGPLINETPSISSCDLILFVGADLIDGTCGSEAALKRLDYARRALKLGCRVIIACSFRLGVTRAIIRQLRELRGVEFWLRDGVSMQNFKRQIGLPATQVPDLSFYYDAEISTPLTTWRASGTSDAPVIALNLSEQSFQSFYDARTDANRRHYVGRVVEQLAQEFPKASFLLLSNDNRSWPNHPSDDSYNELLRSAIVARYGTETLVTQNSHHDYGENIRALASANLLITGRMHLCLAAIRANCPPLILMGRDCKYSSYDKMRGMLLDTLNDNSNVLTKVELLGALANAVLHDIKENRRTLKESADARKTGLVVFDKKVCAELKWLARRKWLFSILKTLQNRLRRKRP